MASRYFRNNKNKFTKTALLLYQKKLIEQHYSFLKCRLEKNILVCKGEISSPDYKNVYQVEIRCVSGCEPYTKILEPSNITPSIKIHMYEDHSLCLHYPPDMKWSARTAIFEYTIPWLIEWIVYYELYIINGQKWEGPESPVHFTEADKNTCEEIEQIIS